MNGKISFGVDFVAIMDQVIDKAIPPIIQFAEISVPILKALLVEWGLSFDEIEQAAKLYADGINSKELDVIQCVLRLVDYLKDNEEAKQRLITHMVTIAYLDLDYTDAQKVWVNVCGRDLNLSPSEINECALKGASFATYLNLLGKAYIQREIMKETENEREN
jgi:hypothetical protein